MAPSDEIPGLGLRTDRPKLNTTLDLASLKLTPTEGFVLSRIDGRSSYDEICRMSALGREETLTILRKLKKAAIILGPRDVVVTPPPVRKPARKSPSPERGHKTPAPVLVTPEMLRKAQQKAGDKPEPAAKEPGSLLARLDNDDPVEPADLIEATTCRRKPSGASSACTASCASSCRTSSSGFPRTPTRPRSSAPSPPPRKSSTPIATTARTWGRFARSSPRSSRA